jgi:glutathione S-transferase
MLRLIIGNKNYSSWSLRGWLALKQSALAFEEYVVPIYDEDWAQLRETADFAPSAGKVPILWDGDAAVWESLAILDYVNDLTGGTRFWPQDRAALALARSMATEMQSGFSALRKACPTNIRRIYPASPVSEAVQSDIDRIMTLWGQARANFGGEGSFLFGEFGAADIMFAPVVTRFNTYSLPAPPFARAYMDASIAHPFMQDWISAAQEEEWVIDRFER